MMLVVMPQKNRRSENLLLHNEDRYMMQQQRNLSEIK